MSSNNLSLIEFFVSFSRLFFWFLVFVYLISSIYINFLDIKWAAHKPNLATTDNSVKHLENYMPQSKPANEVKIKNEIQYDPSIAMNSKDLIKLPDEVKNIDGKIVEMAPFHLSIKQVIEMPLKDFKLHFEKVKLWAQKTKDPKDIDYFQKLQRINIKPSTSKDQQ